MKRIINSLIIILIMEMISCSKEKYDLIVFNPTDHIISTLGSTMRLAIKVPEKGYYNFSSDRSRLNCDGYLCKDFLVQVSEMNETALNLSDTTIFQWEAMTAESPFPTDHYEILIYSGYDQTNMEYYDYMCSMGKVNAAIPILNELAKPLSGDARAAFEEIVSYLPD